MKSIRVYKSDNKIRIREDYNCCKMSSHESCLWRLQETHENNEVMEKKENPRIV